MVGSPFSAVISSILQAEGYAPQPDLAVQFLEVDLETDKALVTLGTSALAPGTQRVLRIMQDQLGSWQESLQAELNQGKWRTCVLDAFVGVKGFRTELGGSTFRGPDAVIVELLRRSADGLCLAVVPVGTLIRETPDFREFLAARGSVRWIIYFGDSAARLLGMYPQFEFVLLTLSLAREPSVDEKVTRLVDLRQQSPDQWASLVKNASLRGGGEKGDSIVLRGSNLDGRPWTFERFSRSLRETLADASALGPLRPLGELVTSISLGLPIGSIQPDDLIQLPDGEEWPSEVLPLFSGRMISHDGTLAAPTRGLRRGAAPPENLLEEGDILVRAIGRFNSEQSVLTAAVPQHAAGGTFDSSIVRIRFSDSLAVVARELVVGYLRSPHADAALRARGAQIHLRPSLLSELLVPEPSSEIAAALETLAHAEQQYSVWAMEARTARRDLLEAKSYESVVKHLLHRERIESIRVQAGIESQEFGFHVRNFFAHPLALRRELLLQLPHGESRLGKTLDCAEFLIQLLAIIALAQFADHSPDQLIPLRGRQVLLGKTGKPQLDWGRCLTLVEQASAATTKHKDPLTLPFPELGQLHVLIDDPASAWSTSEATLRGWRNDMAHLQRLPEPEQERISEEAMTHLDAMFAGAAFTTSTPLVLIEDYWREGIPSKRYAALRLLQGSSIAFRREVREVSFELPRGAIGFLDHHAQFRTAAPWIVQAVCPQCLRSEVFMFNRIEGDGARYVAMESGHPHLVASVGRVIVKVLEEGARTADTDHTSGRA